MHAKPIVVLDPDGVFAPLRAQVDALVDAGFVRAPAREAVQWAATAGRGVRRHRRRRCAAVHRPETVVPAAEDLLESEP